MFHLVGSIIDETLLTAGGCGAAEWSAGEGSRCYSNNQHDPTNHQLDSAGNEALRADVGRAHGDASDADKGASHDSR